MLVLYGVKTNKKGRRKATTWDYDVVRAQCHKQLPCGPHAGMILIL
jgi:hypothetical protein